MKDIDAQLKKVARKVVGDAAKRISVGPTYATLDDIKSHRERKAVNGDAVRPESVDSLFDFQRQLVLVHVRALRRAGDAGSAARKRPSCQYRSAHSR